MQGCQRGRISECQPGTPFSPGDGRVAPDPGPARSASCAAMLSLTPANSNRFFFAHCALHLHGCLLLCCHCGEPGAVPFLVSMEFISLFIIILNRKLK